MKYQALLLLLIILFSCGKSGNERNDNEDIISTVNGKFENGVIRYNNAMVEFMNNSGVYINKVTKDFTEIATMVGSKKKVEFKGLAFSGIQTQNENEDEIVLLRGIGLPSTDKPEIVEKVEAIKGAYSNVRKAYATFVAYIDNEDYTRDDWAKGKELVLILEKNIMDYYEQGEAAYELIRPLTDRNEIELLEEHPLREAMIATKTDFGMSKNILRFLAQETLDMDKINKLYQTLDTSVKKNKFASAEILIAHNKHEYYQKYYDHIRGFLGEVQKSKQDGKFSKNEINSIQNEYKNLLSSYNDFDLNLVK